MRRYSRSIFVSHESALEPLTVTSLVIVAHSASVGIAERPGASFGAVVGGAVVVAGELPLTFGAAEETTVVELAGAAEVAAPFFASPDPHATRASASAVASAARGAIMRGRYQPARR
jgi:hypothetical protein